MSKHDQSQAEPMGMPIFDSHDKRTLYKFAPRWLGAAAVGAALFLVGEPNAIKLYDSVTAGSPSVAGKLAEPFRADENAVTSGQFAPGAVVETPLLYNDLNRDATAYSNADYYGSGAATSDIKTDITAEVGGDPTVKEVYLPAADVNMNALPEGAHVIK